MKITIRELMCAVALGTLAMGVQAQTSDTMKPDPTKPAAATRADDSVKTEADYKAAKEACENKSMSEKPSCLKDAMDAHDRALNAKPSTSGQPMTGQPASGEKKSSSY